MSLPLLALFLAAFALGTAEFVIAGILPDVAAGLDISIPMAGYLITGYAIGIAVGGPLVALATKTVSRRSLILVLCASFTAGQALCALAPNFELLMLARLFVAVMHGTFFGVAPIVATRLVPEDKRGSAVALLLAGLTVSNILGVPAGTAVGNAFGWRMSFWAVGLVGLLATLFVAMVLPRTAEPPTGKGAFMREFKALGRQQIVLSLIIVVAVMIGQYSLFTFIAPLLREVTGLAPEIVPWVLLLYGVGSTIGVFIGGRLADWKLMPSLIVILALQAIVYALIVPASTVPWVMACAVIAWGGINFAFGAPVQTRVLRWAADAPNLASTLIPTAFNLGIAIGAVLGSSMLEAGFGYRDLPWIGTGTLVVAFIVAIVSLQIEKRLRQVPPTPLASPA